MSGDDSVHVRPALPHDQAAVAACVDAAYGPFVEAIGKLPAPMLDDYGQLIERDQVWVAEIDDEVAGLIVMWTKADHWYVDNIAVDPQHQGSGIGSMLLAEAERQTRLAGLNQIQLYTNEAMTSNQDYYPRRGFVETHRAVERGFRRIFYTLALSAE